MNFEKLFKEHGTKKRPYPRHIQYKGKTVFFADKFPVKNMETLIFSIESTDSPHPQGFGVTVFKGYIKVDGEPYSSLRAETFNVIYAGEVKDPKHIEIKFYTKKGHIFIQNIWQTLIYDELKEEFYEGKGWIEKYRENYPEGKRITNSVDGGTWGNDCEDGNGACMYSEDIPNGKRYFCNDGDLDDDFNDIIFTVTRKP